jgi:hypothetical protein
VIISSQFLRLAPSGQTTVTGTPRTRAAATTSPVPVPVGRLPVLYRDEVVNVADRSFRPLPCAAPDWHVDADAGEHATSASAQSRSSGRSSSSC